MTFIASASGGTPPYAFTWDLAGTAAQGETAARRFEAGSYVVRLTLGDAGDQTACATQTVEVDHSVVISSAAWASTPGRLKVSGSGFGPGCTVAINGAAAPRTAYKSAALVVAKGDALKAMLPKGVTVQVAVVNPDGTQGPPVSHTR